MKTLAERMAAYAAGVRFENLPPAVIDSVKQRVIDALGSALGAWHTAPCAAARRVAASFAVPKGSSLLGTHQRVPPDWAAFANGYMVRYLDFNDTYLAKEPAHPSDNIPAALAMAEAAGADGRELIVAIALAYEVQCRLCDAASLRARGWDHVTYGAFSTALGAARLLRLNVVQSTHALGIAGVAGTALRQARVGELSHWKGCAFANAARHGVFAALLAKAGITGPAPIFEGDMGFEKLVSGKLQTDVGEWATGLNPPDFMILKTHIKFWPAEYHAQSAIEAALALRGRVRDPALIAAVEIESHDAAVDIIGSEPEKWRPTHRETADHSLPYLVAVALLDGEVTDRQFTPERLADRKLLELIQRVKVRRHAELSHLYPEAVGNIVTVRLHDGQSFTERVDCARGHARKPLNAIEVESKFRRLATAAIGPERAAAGLDWLWQLERQTNYSELWNLLLVQE